MQVCGVAKLCANRGVAWLATTAVKRSRTEEPDERVAHVRICGGSGRETGCFYPEADNGLGGLALHSRSVYITLNNRQTLSPRHLNSTVIQIKEEK